MWSATTESKELETSEKGSRNYHSGEGKKKKKRSGINIKAEKTER